MRIAYEASSIRRRLSGVGCYTSSLLAALRERLSDPPLLILTHQPQLIKPCPRIVATQERAFPIKELWMQLWVPRIVQRHRPDICHFTNSVAPLYCPAPYVVTVHDLSLVRHPEWHPRSRRLWMARILRPSIERAAGVLCDSEATREDLVSWIDVDASKVWVVPLAPRDSFRITESTSNKEAVKARYGLRRPFLLYVGNIEPRKNLSRLLQAFRLLNPPEIDLVLAGRRAWLCEEILTEAAHPQNAGKVHLLDYVCEKDLPALYQSALAFVYPSLMEGFGLPVLEAMASGTPVVASNVEPLASLVEDAGWQVGPENIEGWQKAISEAIDEDDKRAEFAAAARKKASQYSWDKVACDTLRCYERAFAELPARRTGS